MGKPRSNRRRLESAVKPPSPATARLWWTAAALAAITIAVYAPVAGFRFVTWDDGNYVRIAPVTSGLTWPGIVWAFTTGETANWFPLTWLSHMLDVSLYGADAGGPHITNLLFHVANVLLLFGVLVRMTRAWGASAFVAALFAVHPLHVESVAWVAERKDVLSTFFLWLTVWAYVAYAERPRPLMFLAACVLFAMGLMSKPMLVTLPFVLLLLDVWPLGRVRLDHRATWRKPILEKMPLIAMAGAASVITYVIQQRTGAMGGGSSDAFPLGLRIQNAIVSYAVYLGRTIWPAGLAAFYPFPHSVPLWQLGASVTALATISIVVWRSGASRPYAVVGWLWFLGMLLPVIGLIQVGEQARADRYTYVPLVGIFVLSGWGLMELARRRIADRLLWTAGIGVVAAYAGVAWVQTQTWRDSNALWTRAIAVTSNNDRAFNGLGAELGNHGQFDQAITDFREAIRIDPAFADAYENLAVALSAKGKPAEALPNYAEAIRLQPGFLAAHNNYASALVAVGRVDDGIREYHASLAIDPEQAGTEADLGIALERQGKFQDAIVEEEAALRLNPSTAQAAEAHFGLGIAEASLGRSQDAIDEYEEAERIDPKLEAAHLNRGIALALAHRVSEAIDEFTEVLQLDPGNVTARQALADLRRR